jgi:hypothetical protein
MGRTGVLRLSLCVVLLAGLIVPLFADADGGFKFEIGVSGLFIPLDSFALEEPLDFGDESLFTPSTAFVLPVVTLGIFGQMNLGPVHLGMGLQGYSLIVAGILWPVVYAEVDFWKFTLNATVGGGAFFVHAGFMPFFLPLSLIVPDVSLWLNINKFKLGAGVMTLMDPQQYSEFFSTFSANDLLIYAGFRWAL